MTDLDFTVTCHGSICLFRPVSEAGKEWIAETAPEEAQFWGAAMAVETRYISGVVEAAESSGLVVGYV